MQSKQETDKQDMSRWETDWRNTGQLQFLKNRTIYKETYKNYSELWEHEHCVFCWEKISEQEGDRHIGYHTEDMRYWICMRCFEELKQIFNWRLAD